MSERMRLICALGLIAIIGFGAFTSLQALAAGSERTMSESGLTVPPQSSQSGPQSAPTPDATPDPSSTSEPSPDHTSEPAPEPVSEPVAPAPAPAPAATYPQYVAPSGPQRAVSDDDDDDYDDDDYDDDTDD